MDWFVTQINPTWGECAVDCLSTCHRPRIFQDKCNVFRVSAKSRFHEAEAAWCRAVRPASGGWGLNKLPTCYLTGGQLTRANWKFASARISSGKYFGLQKYFTLTIIITYHMKYLTTIYLFFSSCPAAAVTYAHLENHLRRTCFDLSVGSCGGWNVLTSRQLISPYLEYKKTPEQIFASGVLDKLQRLKT